MKTILQALIIIALFGIKTTKAQELEWVKSIGGPIADGGACVVVDNSGNVYTMGYFNGTVDFDPNSGVYNLSESSPSYSSTFIQKLDATGDFIWAKSIETSINSIAVDVHGNVYATGYFKSTVDFDPGPGIFNLSTNNGSRDFFILKLNSNGSFSWVKSFGGVSSDEGSSITLDESGNIYTTGYFMRTVDFDPGPGIFNLTSPTTYSSDVFILKLDASGNFIWAKSIGDHSQDKGFSIKVDALGNVYTTGSFQGTVDFDPNAGLYSLTSTGSDDIFVSKLDMNGNFVWASSFGGDFSDRGNSLDVDANGNVYTTGYVVFSSIGQKDIFIRKIDVNGNLEWDVSFSSVYVDNIGLSLAVDDSGNVYTTGKFGGTIDFDPGAGVYPLTAVADDNIFILKLDSNANFEWAHTFGYAWQNTGTSIATDAFDNIYTTGRFLDTVDFDPQPSGNESLTSNGGSDIFIHKMSQCVPVYYTDIRTACGSFTWIDGNTYTSNNNTATHTITNGATNGCDSIVTLDLAINTFTTGTDAQTACGSFQWIDGNTYTSNNNTATHTIIGGATNGCDSIVTLNLTINPLPNVSANATQLTICEGDSSRLTGSGAVNYSWDNGVNNGDYINPSSNTTYTVTGTDANNCSNTSQVTITVNPMPTVSISPFSNNTICENTSAVSLPVGSPSGGMYSGTGVSAGTFNPQTSGVGTFDITYTYTNEFNCTSFDMTQITVEGCLGINHEETDIFTVAPNPFSNDLQVSNLKNGSYVSLLDMKGKLVFEQASNTTSLTINTENLESGVYFLEVVSENEQSTKRVVKL